MDTKNFGVGRLRAQNFSTRVVEKKPGVALRAVHLRKHTNAGSGSGGYIPQEGRAACGAISKSMEGDAPTVICDTEDWLEPGRTAEKPTGADYVESGEGVGRTNADGAICAYPHHLVAAGLNDQGLTISGT